MAALLLILILLVIPSATLADMIISNNTVYSVAQGDTLEVIGAKLGVSWKNMARENNIDIKKHLRIGQKIRSHTRKIIPQKTDNGIIVNIPERMLYFFKEGKLITSFPVGLGKPSWETPSGKFKVTGKERNPIWYVPESIQQEMELKGDIVNIIVPPGPDNPLGRYAMKTSLQGILIHETIWPTSVYQFRSHGCIRVLPQHMENLFKEVEINTPGEILYNPVKVAISDSGKVFLEVHRDVYGKARDLHADVKQLIVDVRAAERVDWHKVDRVMKEKSGIAEDITL